MRCIKSILLLAYLLCYTSAQAIWLSPDPLLDKYPYISPYAYCNWNPVKYVDPDGREKKSFFKTNQVSEQYFVRNFKDDHRLHIFSHGNAKGIRIYIEDREIDIPATSKGAKMFSQILLSMDKSQLWSDYLNRENETPLQVVFHGCTSAPMAEAMSKEYPDAYFTGTTESNHSQGGVELGPYRTYEIKIFGHTIDTGKKNSDGKWNTYKNGELIREETRPSASCLKL